MKLQTPFLFLAAISLTPLPAAAQLVPTITVQPAIPLTPPKVLVDPVTAIPITVPVLRSRLNPGDDRLWDSSPAPVPTALYDADRLLSDGASLWAVDRRRNSIVRVDPQTGVTLDVIAPPSGCPAISDFLLETRFVWIGCSNGVYRIHLSTRIIDVKLTAFGGSVKRLAASDDNLLILSHVDAEAFQINSYYFHIPVAGNLSVYSRKTGIMTTVALYRHVNNIVIPPSELGKPTRYLPGPDVGDVVSVDVANAESALVTHRSGLTLLIKTKAPHSVALLNNRFSSSISATAYLDGVLWMLDAQSGQLHRFLVTERRLLGSQTVGGGGKRLLHTGRVVYALLPDKVRALNPLDGTMAGDIAAGLALSDMAFTGRQLLSLERFTGLLHRH